MPDDAATLAHELRTPLNALLGALSMLERSGLSPQQGELVAVAQRAGEDMRRLLDDLLVHARLQAGAESVGAEPIDPALEIASVARLFEVGAQAKGLALRVTLDFPAGLQLLGDRLRLRQILANLLSNAIKFTETGEVLVSGVVVGAALLVQVADSGPGIDAELRARLFQPFQQAHGAKHGGSGLGLAIARGLARAMGGELSVQSEAGAGACFTLTLPAHRPARLAGMRALVVDDHPASRQVVRLILESQGVNVIEAEDGPAALAIFQAMRLDLVLLDQRMPGLSGLAVRARMLALDAAASRPATPIALLSADPALAGAPLIAKPISAESLLAGVGRLLQVAAPLPPKAAPGLLGTG